MNDKDLTLKDLVLTLPSGIFTEVEECNNQIYITVYLPYSRISCGFKCLESAQDWLDKIISNHVLSH